MTNLKHCPFCGGKSFINTGGSLYWVSCQECGAEGSTLTSDDEAIEAWNTRACDECERGAIPATEENMREEIVRCKACSWSDKRWSPMHGVTVRYCGRYAEVYGEAYRVEDNGFCAWGEHKVVEE